eukprot:scaffold56545_cov63-Phaeocystis_antarctica.AAC.4
MEEDVELGRSSTGAETAVVRVAVASSTSGRLRTGRRRALEGGCLRAANGLVGEGAAARPRAIADEVEPLQALAVHGTARRALHLHLAPQDVHCQAAARRRAAAKAGRAVDLREKEGALARHGEPALARDLLPPAHERGLQRKRARLGGTRLRAAAVPAARALPQGPAPARGQLAQLGQLLQAEHVAVRHELDDLQGADGVARLLRRLQGGGGSWRERPSRRSSRRASRLLGHAGEAPGVQVAARRGSGGRGAL